MLYIKVISAPSKRTHTYVKLAVKIAPPAYTLREITLEIRNISR